MIITIKSRCLCVIDDQQQVLEKISGRSHDWTFHLSNINVCIHVVCPII